MMSNGKPLLLISRRRRRESIRTRVLERLKPDANLFPWQARILPSLHSTHLTQRSNVKSQAPTANLPHQPGPYEEIGFGIPHYQDEQLQPGVTFKAKHQVETGLNDSKSLAKQSHGDHHIDAHRAKSTIQFSPQLQKDSWFDEYTANLPQHPGPYKEFDFSVLFDKEVQNPASTYFQTNSTDLPGLSYEATPQDMNLDQCKWSQSDTECSRRRKTVRDGIAGAIARGPSHRHQIPKSLVMYRFLDFAVEDEASSE
ncbi:hypothetical protein KEM48_010118, partial [Puccinia striiformis f. sp. tritici PST-130]